MEADILIIDDDIELGRMLCEFLAPDHFRLNACNSGEQGLASLKSGQFELVILDIMLPGMSGIDVLKEIRKTSDNPVIMLTARGDDVDRILGLEFGADDYLSKPFNPRELLARIKAILRRASAVSAIACWRTPEAYDNAQPARSNFRFILVDDRNYHYGRRRAWLFLCGTCAFSY
jgi:DNA-binding response OmpR family regulator